MSAQPLAGRRILLTRAVAQLPALAEMVRRRGAVPVAFPCLAVESMPDAIMHAISGLERFSDVLFTSCNGVSSVVDALQSHGMDAARLFAPMRVAAVGKQTAACLIQHGIRADILPETASQDGLVDAYLGSGLPERLLFFRAEEGREALAEALTERGIEVETVPAYRTICPDDDASDVIAMLRDGAVDAVLLGSARAALHYLQRVGDAKLAARPVSVAISQKMAAAAMCGGLHVQLVAKSASFEAMLDILSDHFATERSSYTHE